MKTNIIKLIAAVTSFLVSEILVAQTTLQASSKIIVDDGYDYTELGVTPWGGSHSIFFGAKMNYNGAGDLWSNNNTVYAQDAGPYGYGAFSMGYIANSGIFSFYDGGQSTGVGNPISWNPVMTIRRGGNIGLGTFYPLYKLHSVSTGNTGTASALIHGQYYGMAVTTAATSANYYAFQIISGSDENGTGGTSKFYVRADGNVGIGTTSPQSLLSVNGNITAKKLKVTQTGWADYVFHSSYKLPSLSEVEAFIKLHQHLPDVPSTSEVEKNGIDLGENQAVLLKKIEELTLYVIEQNKRMQQLEKKLATVTQKPKR